MISRRGSEDITGRIKKIKEGADMSNDNEFVEPETKGQAEEIEEIPSFEDLPDMTEAAEAAEKYGVIEDERSSKTSVRMAFVGGGQAGSNVVDHCWKLGYRRCLAINTAAQDMSSLGMNKENQYVLEGFDGAGKNPKVGQQAFEKHYEDILRRFHKCLGKNVERIMICCGAGGGTGGGGAEILIAIAKDFFKEIGRPPVIGMLVTTPEKTEKGAVQKNAAILLNRLIERSNAKEISPLVVIDNGQIARFFPGESISNFYPKSNQIVCGIFDRFNTITAYASPIGHNVDGADYKELLAGGLMTYGQCRVDEIRSDTTLAEAIVKNMKNTLLCPEFDLKSATNATCLIVANEQQLGKITKDAVNKAIESLSRVFANPDVKIHLGIYKAAAKGVSICTAVSGLNTPVEKLATMRNN
jgi:cell division GTPase FtsZ